MLNGILAGPQAAVYLSDGSATIDGSAAAAGEARKRAHYARPGQNFSTRSASTLSVGQRKALATSAKALRT